jgi:hypothetical protein
MNIVRVKTQNPQNYFSPKYNSLAHYLLSCKTAKLTETVPRLPNWQSAQVMSRTAFLASIEASIMLHPLHDSNNLWIGHDAMPHVPVTEVEPSSLSYLSGLVEGPHSCSHRFLLTAISCKVCVWSIIQKGCYIILDHINTMT